MQAEASGGTISKSTKGALIGKPPDLCWAYFSTIAGPPDKDGRPTVQTANKRAHRVCNGCGRTMQSCTVKAATSHLEECGKAKTKYPGMLSSIEQDKMRKIEKKGGGPSRLKRESGSQHYDIAAAFWEGEYVTVGPEEECQAFGDEPDAGNVDLAALIAETFN